MDPAELRERARVIDWWHTMDLGHGVTTHGRDRTTEKLVTLQLPERLDGQSVLDIGAWDGAFSFEAERRGAARVLAVDPMWANDGVPGFDRSGFELARAALASKVEDAVIDVHSLDPAQIGRFDVVLLLGVLYHLQDPIGALQRVASVTRGLLVVETHADFLNLRRSAAGFYPGDEVNRDDTNWWGPNSAALRGMLQAVGFQDVHIVYRPTPRQRWVDATRARFTTGDSFRRGRTRGRLVAHAVR